MSHGQTLSQITSRALEGLDPILAAQKPDWVLAQGRHDDDVRRRTWGRFYHKAKFGHVEAGLRTGQPL